MPKKPPPDPKIQALRQHGALNPHPERVGDPLFEKDPFFDRRDGVQVKYEMLRCARRDGQSIRQAAASFGFSRPAFYAAQAAYSREGLPGLIPKKRGPRGGHKLTEEVMDWIEKAVLKDPSLEVEALATRVKERFGLKIHPRSVRRAMARRKKKRP